MAIIMGFIVGMVVVTITGLGIIYVAYRVHDE